MRQIQIQDRGTHKYRQQRNPDLQMDLQSNLQEDPSPNLQADLQKDLQAYLQMDLQANLLKVHYNPLFWCHFNFHYRLRPQLEERSPGSGWGATFHSCHQISVHLWVWEELVSEGGFHKAPNMWLVSYPLNLQLGESLGVHTAIYKSTRIYNLHRSTRLTTSQDIHPYIWRGTVFITFPQMLATTSRQCSYTQSIQPCPLAIRLHHHSVKREQPLWGNLLPTVPKVWLILQFQLQQDQHNIQTVSNNKWHCKQHPTMCVIVWPLEPSEEGLSWSVMCVGIPLQGTYEMWLFSVFSDYYVSGNWLYGDQDLSRISYNECVLEPSNH